MLRAEIESLLTEYPGKSGKGLRNAWFRGFDRAREAPAPAAPLDLFGDSDALLPALLAVA